MSEEILVTIIEPDHILVELVPDAQIQVTFAITGERGEKGDAGVVAADLPLTYDLPTKTIGTAPLVAELTGLDGRISAIEALGSLATDAELAAEAATRAAADTGLDTRLGAIEALGSLATDAELAAEASARAAADTGLDTRIGAIELLGPLATDAELAAEAATRSAADAALDTRLDAIEILGSLATDAELAAEASTRAAADTALDTRLDAIEILGPLATQDDLGTEATARASADAGLDARLDVLEAAPGGARVYFVIGEPSTALGNVNDVAFDTSTGKWYEKTGASTWTLKATINPEPNGDPSSGTFLVSGGAVAWVSGYTYRVSAATYYINAVLVNSLEQQLTLTAPDASLDRIDIIVVDATGTVSVVAGTPAAAPAEPSVDPSTYLKLAIVYLPAASVAAGVTVTPIYTEGAEWTVASNSGNIVVGSTNNPRNGTKCIEATGAVNGNRVEGTTSSVDPNSQEKVVIYIRLKAAWVAQKSLRFTWYNGNQQKGNSVSVIPGTYGFNGALVDTYQQVVIPTAAFAVPLGQTATKLRCEVTGGGSGVGFYLDDWQLQVGVNDVPNSVFLRFRGNWDSSLAYAPWDVIHVNGSMWVSISPGTGQLPSPGSTYWALLGSIYGFANPMTAKGDIMIGSALGAGTDYALWPTNSLGVIATSGTQFGASTHNNIVDGNDGSIWASSLGVNAGPWFVIDLGQVRQFSAVRLYTDTSPNNATQWGVDSSNDNLNWTRRYTSATGQAGGDTGLVALAFPVNARYVRVVCLAGSSGNTWRVHTFNVYQNAIAAGSPTRLAAGADRTLPFFDATAPNGVVARAIQNADLPASGAAAGTKGSATKSAIVTVNDRGIVTSLTETDISGGGSGGGGPTVPNDYVKATRSGDQALANAAFGQTVMAWNAESNDSTGMHDPATNNSRITVVRGGVPHVLIATVQYAGNAGSYVQTTIRKNGTTALGAIVARVISGSLVTTAPVIAVDPNPSVGDYYEVLAGGEAANLTAQATDGGTWFQVITSPPAIGDRFSYFDVDKPPASANAKDDEFTGGALDGKWTWLNQGTATATVADGRLKIAAPVNASGHDELRSIRQAIPATPYRVVAKISMRGQFTNYANIGLALYASAGGKLQSVSLGMNATGRAVNVYNWSSVSLFSSTAFAGTVSIETKPFIYVAIEDDGTNLTYYASGDGIGWTKLYTNTRAAWIGTPTDFVLYASSNNATDTCDLICEWIRVIATGAITGGTRTVAGGEPQLLFDQTLAVDASSIDTGAIIPPGYTELEIVLMGRTDEATVASLARIHFNGDTGANQYPRQYQGGANGSGAVGATQETGVVCPIPGSTSSANVAGCYRIKVPAYDQTTFYKTCEATGGAGDPTAASSYAYQIATTWKSTAAITRVQAIANSPSNFKAGSRLTIYGRR